jgi:FAD/FMN-containing dehydrogenase
MNYDLLALLTSIVGKENLSVNMADRICYTRDRGPDPGCIPAAVVRPRTTEDVSKILKAANQHHISVFVWSRGTTTEGLGILEGSIVMDLNGMTGIQKIDEDAMFITVQAGAVWQIVNTELKKNGWKLPIVGPGSLFSSTVGGCIAINSIPHGVTQLGMTGEHVISLTVVLPSGEIVRTGSAANPNGIPFERYCLGPDVTGLFVGSSGVFGVVTEATLRIVKDTPDDTRYFCYTYDDHEDAIEAAKALQRERCTTFIAGLFGAVPNGADALLHIIVEGEPKKDAGKLVEQICSAKGKSMDPGSTRRYWTTHMYSWMRGIDPKDYHRDDPYSVFQIVFTVPLKRLGNAVELTRNYVHDHREELERSDIKLRDLDVYFHKGGAFSFFEFWYTEQKKESWDAALDIRRELSEQLFKIGACALSRGMGSGLAPYIMPKLGSYYDLLKALKKTLDPNEILNPGIFYL